VAGTSPRQDSAECAPRGDCAHDRGLDHEEIKKGIKSMLGSVPSNVVLDAHSSLCLDDDFIKMVSAPTLLLLPLFLGLFTFLFA
jgi:hypothetical protein